MARRIDFEALQEAARRVVDARADLSPREKALLDVAERMEKAGPATGASRAYAVPTSPDLGAYIETMPTKTDITASERIGALERDIHRSQLLRMGASDMEAVRRIDKHIAKQEQRIDSLERHAGRKATHQQMEDEQLIPSAARSVSDPGELPPLVQEDEPVLTPWWGESGWDTQRQRARLKQFAGYGEDEGGMGRHLQEAFQESGGGARGGPFVRGEWAGPEDLRRRSEAVRNAVAKHRGVDELSTIRKEYDPDEGEMGRYQQELLKAEKMSSQEAEMRRRSEAAIKEAAELREIEDYAGPTEEEDEEQEEVGPTP